MNHTIFLFPIAITRSIKVLKTRGEKSQVSTVFIANFGDGAAPKNLRSVRWVLTDLMKPNEIGAENETFLNPANCPLYRLDWSKNPTFGDFKKNYPQSVAARAAV